MTIEIPTKKVEEETEEKPVTCEELLGRVIDLPHRSGSIKVDAPASALSPYIPKRNKETEEQPVAENQPEEKE